MFKKIISALFVTFSAFALYTTAYAANPAGSYQATCSNIVVNGETLSATCKNMSGASHKTDLPFATSCVGNISNVNGILVCTGATGSFARTCKDASIENGKLSANCQKADGSWMVSNTTYSGFQHQVANCNGQLVDKPNC